MSFFKKEQFLLYLANRLYFSYLMPIENSIYSKDKEIITNKEMIKRLLDYTNIAYRLIEVFNPKSEIIPDKVIFYEQRRNEQKINATTKEIFFELLKDKFIYDKEISLTGMDLHNPFAFWVQELYAQIESKNLQITDIKKVEICEHGDIKFINSNGESFGAINYQSGQYKCGECNKPKISVTL